MNRLAARSVTWCLAACAAGIVAARADVAVDAGKAAAARAILDAWHATDPQPGDRKLHVVAWRARDRDFAADHRGRLDRILTHIQDFYRREMERHGLGPCTIRLDRDADGAMGSVVCLIRVDGTEKFRSRRLGTGECQDFDVDVAGARDLELRVEDAGDGNRSDWAAWLAPVLVRTDREKGD